MPKLAYVALRARTGRKRKGAAKGDAKKDDAAKKDDPSGNAAKPHAWARGRPVARRLAELQTIASRAGL